jgi:uncharacterized protein YlxW (UPF0749 family)
MSLISDLFANPIDDGYAEAARRRAASGGPERSGGSPKASPALLLGLLALGLLLGIAALQVRQNAGVVSAERESLVERIQSATADADKLERDLADLERSIVKVEAGRLNSLAMSNELRDSIAVTQGVTGTRSVSGPGVVVEIDDAEGGNPSGAQASVLDLDVQQVVNGLWAAGAEAVAVNGQRVTALTAIRSANDVILVNFRPLTPPYEVSAIGDARTLGSRFLEGSGGAWLLAASSTAGIQFDVRTEQSLTLPAASAALRLAEPREVS